MSVKRIVERTRSVGGLPPLAGEELLDFVDERVDAVAPRHVVLALEFGPPRSRDTPRGGTGFLHRGDAIAGSVHDERWYPDRLQNIGHVHHQRRLEKLRRDPRAGARPLVARPPLGEALVVDQRGGE
jgi:hypothetical protein